MQITNETKAEILAQALPYIKKYTGEIIVVKYSGDSMSAEAKKGVMKDVALLQSIGVKVVLVHGKDEETASVLADAGFKTAEGQGTEYADGKAVAALQMVLAGKVNKDLVNLLELEGGNAVGLCGIDGHMLLAEPENEGSGFLGKVARINAQPLVSVLNEGSIPVVGALGYDDGGNVYALDADAVAARLAGELKAKCLINMTDQKGILRDKNDASSLISVLNVSEVPRLVKDGVICGGMVAKAECCVEAIRRGVKRVFVIDGTVAHSLLVEILSDEGIGTMFV